MKKFRFVDPQTIVAIVVTIIILAVGSFVTLTLSNTVEEETAPKTSTSTTTYTETFEDDNNTENPTAPWYTYTEIGWEWANVTNATGYSSSQSFRMNDATATTSDFVNFTFTTDDYESFTLWFKYDNSSHNQTRLSFLDSSSNTICFYDIGGTPSSGKTGETYFFNYSVRWTESTSNNTWYKLQTDFNWTNKTVRGRIYDASNTLLNDSGYVPMWMGAGSEDNLTKISIKGYANQPAYIWFDSLTLYDEDTSTYSYNDVDLVATSNSVFNIIGVVLVISAILAIISIIGIENLRR